MVRRKECTFEKAKELLKENPTAIIYDVMVKIDGHWHYGDLMTIEEWKECVRSTMFIDDDGWGDVLDEVGNYIGRCAPSRARSLSVHSAYILWYNK